MHMIHLQNTHFWNIIMVVSQVIFSGITLEPHVYQLVTSTLTLAHSAMMMQLCCHYWEVKIFQQCALLLATPTISYQAGQHTVKLHLCRITCAADVMQYASKRDLHAHVLSGENSLRHSPVYRRSRPKHAVSEGLLTLAEDTQPEATVLIGLSWYAVQRHAGVIIYIGRVTVGRRLNLWHNDKQPN